MVRIEPLTYSDRRNTILGSGILISVKDVENKDGYISPYRHHNKAHRRITNVINFKHSINVYTATVSNLADDDSI